ncbi:hypothetical protein CVT24_006359 [Panaeolus cyanescens]|uniref:Uncharacterized protein n=1 Tax=Panaeolus cyanescens TaxID=181874 RepID=A0A409YE63_9AGAR|nr:hypothetical protein CVT24_006359 [Panaeolus cyanescens]
MSARLLHRTISSSNVLCRINKPQPHHIHSKFNYPQRAKFHSSSSYSSPNSASPTSSTTVKILPSLGQAAANELVKKLESGDARLTLTAEDKKQIQDLALKSFTTIRCKTITELNKLPETFSSVLSRFVDIERIIRRIDNGGLLSRGQPIYFTERWTQIQKEYTDLIKASEGSANAVRKHVAKLAFDIIPAVNDAKTADEKRGIIDMHIENLRDFETAVKNQEHGMLRLREKIDAYHKDVQSVVAENKKDLAFELKLVNEKIEKRQKELDKFRDEAKPHQRIR